MLKTAGACQAGVISENIGNGNGKRKYGDGTSIGTIYEYECNEGYQLVGEPYIICRDDATWSQSNVPSCRRKTFCYFLFFSVYCF